MSADLFAAFGHDVPPHKASNGEREGETGSRTGPNILLEGLETLGIEQQRDLYNLPPRSKQQEEVPLWHQDSEGTDVLFDATEDPSQADDDFGDFEDVDANTGGDETPSASATYPKQEVAGIPMSSTMPTHDLLALEQEDANGMGFTVTPNHPATSMKAIPTSNTEREAFATSNEDDWGDFSTPYTKYEALSTKHAKATTHQMTAHKPQLEQEPIEDEWDAFEDGNPESSTHPQAKAPQLGLTATPTTAMPRLEPPPKSNPTTQSTCTSPAEAIRPSNIPPPAILLQLLPIIFADLRQTATQQAKGLEKTTTYLSLRDIALTVIQAFTVAARIIAGRSFRWKRDAILSQSMRIGPAASAGGGGRGMKLAAIDKSESLKEEKEAADVVSVWGKNAHLFNSTVSKAGVPRPLMALYLSVRPRLTSGVDILKASHACALCGINRDERVPQVDINVEDSFGEYWIEHWGHRDCRDFWFTYKDNLHQR